MLLNLVLSCHECVVKTLLLKGPQLRESLALASLHLVEQGTKYYHEPCAPPTMRYEGCASPPEVWIFRLVLSREWGNGFCDVELVLGIIQGLL